MLYHIILNYCSVNLNSFIIYYLDNYSLFSIFQFACLFEKCLVYQITSNNTNFLKNIIFNLYFQAYNVQCSTFISNIPTHSPDIYQLLINVDIHDIQCLVMLSCFIWCYFGLFLIWMEKICSCRRYRTLPLKLIYINTYIYYKMYTILLF